MVVKVESTQKYLILPKCGTKYQKVGPDTNLIYFLNTFHNSTARKKFKTKVPKSTHCYFTKCNSAFNTNHTVRPFLYENCSLLS